MAMPSVHLTKGKNQSTQTVVSPLQFPFYSSVLIIAVGSLDFQRHAQVLFHVLIQYMIKLHLNTMY